MEQANELQSLLKLLQWISNDILVYTGYQIEELPKEHLFRISVLIDGAYIESRNNNCILRGSDNQRIYILDDNLREKYTIYCETEQNQIQNFMTMDGIISVGIHKPNFIDDLNDIILQKGLKENNE